MNWPSAAASDNASATSNRRRVRRFSIGGRKHKQDRIVNPDEVGALTAFPSDRAAPPSPVKKQIPEQQRVPQSPERSSPRKLDPKSYARMIDARVQGDSQTYTNDLLRNATKKAPSVRLSSPRRPAGPLIHRSSSLPASQMRPPLVSRRGSIGSVISNPAEDQTTYSKSYEPSVYSRNTATNAASVYTQNTGRSDMARRLAKQIDARVQSDQSSYTNDLLRQANRKQHGLRRDPAIRKKAVPLPSMPEKNTCIIELQEEELLQLAMERSIRERDDHDSFDASTISSYTWAADAWDNSSRLDDDMSSARMAEVEQEREMIEMAMEASLREERERRRVPTEIMMTGQEERLARIEQDMLDLAMERSVQERPAVSSVYVRHR